MENNILDTQFLRIILYKNVQDITGKPHIGYGGIITPSLPTGIQQKLFMGNKIALKWVDNYILAGESPVNRNMGNFLIDGYESKSYRLKMVNRTDWNCRPKLLLTDETIRFVE